MSFEVKNNQDMNKSLANLSASFNSDKGNVTNARGYSIQAVWTGGGSPVGTMSLQASTDGTNWSDISTSTLSVSGNSGNNIFNVKDVYYNFVRLVYTRTSGTANVSITLISKG